MIKQLPQENIQATEKDMFLQTAAIPELTEVTEQLTDIISSNSSITVEIGKDLVLAGGKRLRPLLVILSGRQFKAEKKDLIAASTAIELIHMASLVHDDIIDKAAFRRGQPSVNFKWGEKTAVLMGDFLFAKAFGLLAEQQLYSPLKLVVGCIQEMCDGEIEQDKYKFNVNQSLQDYYQRIFKKTAKLISACCQIGAQIGQAGAKEELALAQFGLNLGYAFQITDDILDFIGQEATLGKPVASDLTQGNFTLPILLLLKDKKWGPWLRKKLAQKSLSPDNLIEIENILKKSGAIHASLAKAYLHIRKAKNSLSTLPDSPYSEKMKIIADKVISRKH